MQIIRSPISINYNEKIMNSRMNLMLKSSLIWTTQEWKEREGDRLLIIITTFWSQITTGKKNIRWNLYRICLKGKVLLCSNKKIIKLIIKRKTKHRSKPWKEENWSTDLRIFNKRNPEKYWQKRKLIRINLLCKSMLGTLTATMMK